MRLSGDCRCRAGSMMAWNLLDPEADQAENASKGIIDPCPARDPSLYSPNPDRFTRNARRLRLRPSLSPEARHGAFGGLRPRLLSTGRAGGVDCCDCRAPPVDGDRCRLGRFA